MNWQYKRGVWISGALTIRIETCPYRKLAYFELFDTTRFVRAFASLQEAMGHAEAMQLESASRRVA